LVIPTDEASRIGKVRIEGDVDYSVTIDQGDLMLGNHPKRNPLRSDRRCWRNDEASVDRPAKL